MKKQSKIRSIKNEKHRIKRKNKSKKLKSIKDQIIAKGSLETLRTYKAYKRKGRYGEKLKEKDQMTYGYITELFAMNIDLAINAGSLSQLFNYLKAKDRLVGELDQTLENNLDHALLKNYSSFDFFNENVTDKPKEEVVTEDIAFYMLEYIDSVAAITSYLEYYVDEVKLVEKNIKDINLIIDKIAENNKLKAAKEGDEEYINPIISLYELKMDTLLKMNDEIKSLLSQLEGFQSEAAEEVEPEVTDAEFVDVLEEDEEGH